MARSEKEVKKTKRVRRYSDEVKKACIRELLSQSTAQVAKQHGISVPTLRKWQKEQQAEQQRQDEEALQKKREQEMLKIGSEAAEGARITAELMCRRIRTSAINLERVEQIDRILLGSEKSGGLVIRDGTAVAEQREKTALSPDLRGKLEHERSERSANIPSDHTLTSMLRTFAQVSDKACAKREENDTNTAQYEEFFKDIEGEEW